MLTIKIQIYLNNKSKLLILYSPQSAINIFNFLSCPPKENNYDKKKIKSVSAYDLFNLRKHLNNISVVFIKTNCILQIANSAFYRKIHTYTGIS